jgi:hypothetical protein
MEPLTVVGAAIVIYCGWLSVRDELRCWRSYRVQRRERKPAAEKSRLRTAAVAGQGDAAAVRWPALAAGSA